MANRMMQTVVLIMVAAAIGTIVFWQVDLVHRGGPVMIPIVMCSVFAVAVIGERFYYFFQLHLGKDIGHFFTRLREAVERRQWNDAKTLCDSWQGPVARVARAGIEAREGTSQEIDEAMEETAHEEMPVVERHLRWLSTTVRSCSKCRSMSAPRWRVKK